MTAPVNLYRTMTKTFDYSDALRNWSDTASVKDLLAVLSTKERTADDWRAYYFEHSVDVSMNIADQATGFRSFLQWKFRCKVATSNQTEQECLCWKVVNKTQGKA